MDLPSSLALARVGSDVLEATEDLEGGVTLNAVVLAEVGLLSAVDLGESDVLLLEGSGSLLVLGGEGLAVTAPGSEDCREILSVAVRFERDGLDQDLHSARTRSLDLTNSSKVSLVSCLTSESAAEA